MPTKHELGIGNGRIADEQRKLAGLRDDDILTQDAFDAQKSKRLGRA